MWTIGRQGELRFSFSTVAIAGRGNARQIPQYLDTLAGLHHFLSILNAYAIWESSLAVLSVNAAVVYCRFIE